MEDKFAKAFEENRYGKFSISKRLIIKDADFLVEQVFSKIFITYAEYRFGWDGIEYNGYSPEFDSLDVAVMPVEYKIVFERNMDEFGNVSTKAIFERIE